MRLNVLSSNFVFSPSVPIKSTTAEDYDQNYYIKHPEKYANFRNVCGRSHRLKEVWGEKLYDCYHDETHSCFFPGDSIEDDLAGKILNSYGEVVVAESNNKAKQNIQSETSGSMSVVITLISFSVFFVIMAVVNCCVNGSMSVVIALISLSVFFVIMAVVN